MSIQTDLYDEMVERVVTFTNRPDQTGEIAIAMETATRSSHLSDRYFRDVATTLVQLPNSANQFAIDIPTTLPRFRGAVQIRPVDLNYNLIYEQGWGNAPQIEVVEVGDIYDPEYGNVRNNIAFVSGSNLVIRYPLSVGGFIIEYVQAPQTKRDLYLSWIAQECPDIITYWASAILYATNGNDQKAQALLRQIEQLFIPQLKQNYLLSVQR